VHATSAGAGRAEPEVGAGPSDGVWYSAVQRSVKKRRASGCYLVGKTGRDLKFGIEKRQLQITVSGLELRKREPLYGGGPNRVDIDACCGQTFTL
jgi:hypothetical protein